MIIATLASLSTREALLAKTIETLLPQVDAVCVYLNGYKTVPQCLIHPKVLHALLSHEVGLRGAEGKLFFWDRDLFKAAPIWRDDDIAIIVDDDIMYPSDYVAKLVAQLDKQPKSIACVHGSSLMTPFERYATSRWVASARGPLASTTRVNIPGTGTMAFRAGSFSVSLREHFPWSHCVDVCVGIQAMRQGVECWAVARPDGWLKPMALPKGTSIYKQRTGAGNDEAETRLISSAGEWPLLESRSVGMRARQVIGVSTPHINENSMLPPEVAPWIGERLAAMRATGTVVELGSGHGTARLSAALPPHCNLMSIEHDERFVDLVAGSKYVHARIVNGWYNRVKVKSMLPHPSKICALIVDGPPAKVGKGRTALLDHLDLFPPLVPILLDDVNRTAEMLMAKEIGQRRKQRVYLHHSSGGRMFATIGWGDAELLDATSLPAGETRHDSIGRCSLCGYEGPGPAHDCPSMSLLPADATEPELAATEHPRGAT